ncbi:helix-turn-helix domain-containing protein [Pasteurella multocida]
MSISERLKLVCQEKNWKLKDFSEATGLPYRTAQGYLNGTREPNAEGMAAIAKLGVNLNWLVVGEGDVFNKYTSSLTCHELSLLESFRNCNELGQRAVLISCVNLSNDVKFKCRGE